MLRIGQVESSATADGKYTDGSVAGGIAATRLRAAAFNAIQEELANIVESAGMSLDPDDMTQVLAALKKQFLSRSNPFSDIKADGAAAVASALANLGLGEAAKRDVGTEANQIPDMSAFQVIDSPGRGWHVLPNGHIHQYGIATLAAVSNYNKQTIGGVDYYTRYYVVTLPRAYPTAHQVTTVTIAGRLFDNQGGTYGLWATCNRNVDSSGPSLTSFTVSVTTVDPTQVPVIHYSSEGY